ncbi:hypothetical protein L7F22_068983 [Adiantum nelumboides]|nr:hypothetical protein [Adiantum nelumboides]
MDPFELALGLPFSVLRIPRMRLKIPTFSLPSPMTVFSLVLVTYFMVVSGIVYDVIVEPPGIGSRIDRKTLLWPTQRVEKDREFNTGVKEGSVKKNSAKYFLKEVIKATQEPAKAWQSKATAELAKGPTRKWKRPFARKSEEQKQVLRSVNKCFTCEQPGHIAPNCPQRKRPADSEDKEDLKGKKPMVGLVPDMVGDEPNSDASELCRARGKVRDQTMLIFFDPGAKANFISPELASKLGIRPEEMWYTAEAGLACPGHTDAVTSIIGKLRLHIQSYVDAEEFYIMSLDGCDVLLGIPWMFRVQGIMDAYNKKIIVQSRGKTHILDVKLKGECHQEVHADKCMATLKRLGARQDPVTGAVRPVVFLSGRVNGQYIIEGLSSGFMFLLGGLGFILLDLAVDKNRAKSVRLSFLGAGVSFISISYAMSMLFVRIKIPAYLR